MGIYYPADCSGSMDKIGAEDAELARLADGTLSVGSTQSGVDWLLKDASVTFRPVPSDVTEIFNREGLIQVRRDPNPPDPEHPFIDNNSSRCGYNPEPGDFTLDDLGNRRPLV